jgi:hypothetical protein
MKTDVGVKVYIHVFLISLCIYMSSMYCVYVLFVNERTKMAAWLWVLKLVILVLGIQQKYTRILIVEKISYWLNLLGCDRV